MSAPGVEIRWDRRALGKLAVASVEAQLMKAGQYLRTQVVKNISVPTRVHGPSKPGEFPRADTGRLRQSIVVKRYPGPLVFGAQSSEVRIGTPLRHGLYHEYLSGRSFLRRTLAEEIPRLRQFFRGARVSKL